jgi:predicted NUDIX family NTP pyrophosphohydrolase
MKQSAGILLYKKQDSDWLFFLVHPGGPFWKNKDSGAWSVPKGEFADDENPLDAAIREFKEETGTQLDGNFTMLDPIKLKSGKTVHAWAHEGDIDATAIASNTFEIEWPPKSGKSLAIPEVDRGAWLTADEATEKINQAQAGFINQLHTKLKKS